MEMKETKTIERHASRSSASFSEANLEAAAVKIQSVARGAQVRRHARTAYSPRKLLASIRDRQNIHVGYMRLSFTFLFIGVFIAMLLSQRTTEEDYAANSLIMDEIRGVVGFDGGISTQCRERLLYYTQIGTMMCTDARFISNMGNTSAPPPPPPPSCPEPSSSFSFDEIDGPDRIADWIESFVSQSESYDSQGMLDSRDGWSRVSRYNRVYGGMIFEIRRKKSKTCGGLSAFYPVCRDDDEDDDTEPYGSSDDFGDIEPPTLFRNVCPPFAFEAAAKRYVAFYPSLYTFPMAANIYGIMFALNKNYHLMDYLTKEAALRFVLYNGHTNRRSAVSIVWSFEATGRVTSTLSVNTVSDHRDYPEAEHLYWVFIAMLPLYFISNAHANMLKAKRSEQSFLQMICRPSFAIDMGNLALYIYGVIKWSSLKDEVENHVIDEFLEQVTLEVVMAKGLDVANEMMGTIIEAIIFTNDLVASKQTYFTIQACSLAVSLFRMFEAFAFQKRLAMVTATLVDASVDLFHFLCVWGIILCMYAAIGALLFGTSVAEFSTMWESISTLFVWQMGAFDTSVLYTQHEILGPIFFMSYIVFMFLILINMFLAIIMSAWDTQYTLNAGQNAANTSIHVQVGAMLYYIAQMISDRVRSLIGQPAVFCTLSHRAQVLTKLVDASHRKTQWNLMTIGIHLRREMPPEIVDSMLHEAVLEQSNDSDDPVTASVLRQVLREEMRLALQQNTKGLSAGGGTGQNVINKTRATVDLVTAQGAQRTPVPMTILPVSQRQQDQRQRDPEHQSHVQPFFPVQQQQQQMQSMIPVMQGTPSSPQSGAPAVALAPAPGWAPPGAVPIVSGTTSTSQTHGVVPRAQVDDNSSNATLHVAPGQIEPKNGSVYL